MTAENMNNNMEILVSKHMWENIWTNFQMNYNWNRERNGVTDRITTAYAVKRHWLNTYQTCETDPRPDQTSKQNMNNKLILIHNFED